MKRAIIVHLRETTQRTYEVAKTIHHRLALNKVEFTGWNDHDATVEVWKVLQREKGYSATQASIEMARTKALREAETLPLEDEHLAAKIAFVNGVHDTAVDILAELDTFQKAKGGDPNEVAVLVDEAESADEVVREARCKLTRIDAAITVRALLDMWFARLEADLRGQTMTREEAEKSICEMVFEDKS